jgi:hypothetical protein
MRFLNTRFSQEITIDTINNPQKQREPATELIQEEKHRNVSEIGLTASNSTNLMSKFYRYETLFNIEPPEVLYENEAWAPTTESIGLFHKRRVNIE